MQNSIFLEFFLSFLNNFQNFPIDKKKQRKNPMNNFILLCLFIFYLIPIFSCTTLVVTKGATTDGSVIVAHSDDDELGDQRIIYVPAKDHKKGSKRAIYPYIETYPRYVGKARGPEYDIKEYPPTKPTGYIDQIEHTYSYFDANYGIINEHQLAIGEATDISYYSYKPNKDMILEISELSRIALERCKKAKEAILTIGELAEKYGYYDDAETLIFADPEEAWVFEISASPYKKGALWVAKKVPDGEVFVAANELRIRDVDPKDPDMLYSKDLFKIAEEQKWWDPQKKEKFDWLKSISPGEYNHPYYSLRRVWRLQTKINPNLKLSPWVEDAYTREYPFSIKPTKKLSVYDVMQLFRDHYEGTEFDLTKGLAAGPFGCPQRYVGPYDLTQNIKDKKFEGAWERPISMFYCGYVYINHLRGWLPDPIGGVSWIGLNNPYTTCFVPFYIGINDLPISYQTGSPYHFSHDTAWWAYNFIANLSTLKYSYMKEDIQKMQKEIETNEVSKQSEIEKKALNLYKQNTRLSKEFLTEYCLNNADAVLKKWWQLSYFLIEKYSDGYLNKPKMSQEIGYPAWWRDKVGYKNGPTTYKKKDS